MRLLLSLGLALSTAPLAACGTIPGFYPPEYYEEESQDESGEAPPAPPETIAPEVYEAPAGAPARASVSLEDVATAEERAKYEQIFTQLYCDRTGQHTGTPETLIVAGGLTQARYSEIQTAYQSDDARWADFLMKTYERCK